MGWGGVFKTDVVCICIPPPPPPPPPPPLLTHPPPPSNTHRGTPFPNPPHFRSPNPPPPPLLAHCLPLCVWKILMVRSEEQVARRVP